MITMVMMVKTMGREATTVVMTVMTDDDVRNAHQPNNDQQRGCSIPPSVQTNLT